MTLCARASGGSLAALLLSAAVLLVLVFGASSVRAQDEMEDVFGDLGTAEAIDEDGSEAAEGGQGTVAGQVIDAETGAAISGVTVILAWPDPGDGSEPRQEVAVTDIVGNYELTSVPAGSYELSFVKSGYRVSNLTGFEVVAGEVNPLDFPLPPLPVEGTDDVMQLEAFVVDVATVDEMMASLELRMDSDQLLNILSAEDLSKFASSDVADALKRVAGVNIVEGQFAIIRGLEERYSSTLYNGGVVPSPDPNRQSVQLDLFTSDIVGNLAVSKTFGQDLPSNSAGGSIDILTYEYPDTWSFSLSAGTGFEDRALDRFVAYRDGSATGFEADDRDVIESDIGGSLGGRFDLFGREARLELVVNREIDYGTAEGWQESRQPAIPVSGRQGRQTVVIEAGDLALGELNRSGGRFELTSSTREQQDTFFAALGIDLDPGGAHRIDGSFYRTEFEDETVQRLENGYIPLLDYAGLSAAQAATPAFLPQAQLLVSTTGSAKPAPSASAWIISGLRDELPFQRGRGALWFSSFGQSTNLSRERALTLFQLNGSHELGFLEGLEFDWVANYATTTQDESATRLRYTYEPCGFETDGNGNPCPEGVSRIPFPSPMPPPIRISDLGPGQFNSRVPDLVTSSIDIEETQLFARADARYERSLGESITAEVSAGGWYEAAERDVDSVFDPGQGIESPFRGKTLEALGRAALAERPDAGFPQGTNESTRDVLAVHGGSKLTFLDMLDVYGGIRVESFEVESKNDPFRDDFNDDPAFPSVPPGCNGLAVLEPTPVIFPSRYLFFDRLDNCARVNTEGTADVDPDFVYNDQILGIRLPVDPVTGIVDTVGRAQLQSLLDGEIDETHYLPSVGLALRPIEGLTLRGAYSETVARPSFRELGYYVSTQPGDDLFEVGNPQLGLSEVQSWDARLEYVFGDGDLFALSLFQKEIENPIEAIILADFRVNGNDRPDATLKTFFNNPNTADLRGVEAEARKVLDFLPWGPLGFLQYFTVGGNFTWIDAEVARTDVERERLGVFFTPSEDPDFVPFATSLARKRRLFNQPEWIANADISFDHPDWGTRITLAYFAISDVLRAVGGGSPGRVTSITGQGFDFTLDEYDDEFYQLDLIASQSFDLPWKAGTLTLKTSLKNLTDSRRRVVYDPEALRDTVVKREFRQGRDYSFAIKYAYEFGGR